MSKDIIGDFLTVIRNGIMASKRWVQVPHSKEKAGIAKVLHDEGYIRTFEQAQDANGKAALRVQLKYVDGVSSIHEITRKSTPGRRAYESVDKLTKVVGGLGVSILTTNKGIITDRTARELNVGGEVLAHVW